MSQAGVLATDLTMQQAQAAKLQERLFDPIHTISSQIFYNMIFSLLDLLVIYQRTHKPEEKQHAHHWLMNLSHGGTSLYVLRDRDT